MPRRWVPASVTRALLALAAASGAGVVVAYLIAIRTAEGRRLDDLAKGPLSEQSRAFDETSDLLDTISVSSLALLGAAIMAIALLRGRPRLALGAGVIVLAANLTTQAMKAQLDRPGPFGPEAGSYPSGHVTVAMSLAMALILVTPPDLRVAATLLGAGYAIAVGVAVVAVDWHRPSDVVGAYFVTVAWTAVVTAVLVSPAGAGELGRRGRTPSRAVRAAGAVAALLGVAFAAIVAGATLSRLDLVQVADDRTAFAAAAAVCALACAGLAAVVATLIQRAASFRPGAPAR